MLWSNGSAMCGSTQESHGEVNCNVKLTRPVTAGAHGKAHVAMNRHAIVRIGMQPQLPKLKLLFSPESATEPFQSAPHVALHR